MWDLIVSVPDHRLSFYFAPVVSVIQLTKGDFLSVKNGST